MLILPDYQKAYSIESLTSPIGVKHNWMFNADKMDFFLTPITYLEETKGPAVKALINEFEFWVPASWKILVTDRETYQLDTVEIQKCANIKHLAVAFSPNEMNLRTHDVTLTDYTESMSLTHVMIPNGTSLIHPCGLVSSFNKPPFVTSVIIGPNDLYNKYLKGKVVGDLFS